MNNVNYQETISNIVSAIQDSIRTLIKTETKCDQTNTAQVIKVINAQKVIVKYNDSEYTSYTNVNCEVGDIVFVTAPCGNWADLFVTMNKGKRMK